MTHITEPTWDDLVALEPELESLRAEAATIPLYTCGVTWFNDVNGIKQRLRKLVGYDARKAALRCSTIYDIAHAVVYGALPFCDRRCVDCGAPVPTAKSFVVGRGDVSGLRVLAEADNYDRYTERGRPTNSVCVVIDVLGFTQLVRAAVDEGAGNWSFKRYREVLDRSAAYLEPYATRWSIKVYSDNLLIGYPVHDDGEAELGTMLDGVARFQMSMAINGHFVRGGVTLGSLYMDSQTIFGKALLDGHDAEREADNPRIILSQEAIRCISVYCDYMKGEGAPERRLLSFYLRQDSDEKWFVDYLTAVAARGYPPSVDAAALLAHKEAVMAQLRTASEHIRDKYLWTANYHNAVCAKVDRTDLLIPGVDAGSLTRELNADDLASAQTEFGRRLGDAGLSTETLVGLANRASRT